MSLTSPYQMFNEYAIIDKFCSKWTSAHISLLGLHLQCDIALKNPFS